MRESTLRALSGAASRLMDELPVVTLAAIAVLLILTDGKGNLTHDAVLAIVSGFLGFMKSRGSAAPAARPALPPIPIASAAPAADEPDA